MNHHLLDLATKLNHDWCDSFETWVDGNRLVVSTAAAFPDGDGFPVFIRRQREGWQLSDDGGVSMHLPSGDEYTFSEPRIETLKLLAAAHGAQLGDDGVLRRSIQAPPTPASISAFHALIAAMASAPLIMAQERSVPFRSRIIQKVRKRTTHMVDQFMVERWRIPERPHHRCDLWLPRVLQLGEPGVATFFVASTGAVANASLFTYSIKEIGREDIVVAGYDDRRIPQNSTDILKLREAGATAIGIHDDDPTRFIEHLEDLGVQMRAA